MRSRYISALVLSFVVVAAGNAWAQRAAACTCDPSLVYVSEPKAGASDVALNQAVIVLGTLESSSITWEEVDGGPVAFEVTHGPTPGCSGVLAELVATELLRPNTAYVVRVEAASSDSEEQDATIKFTTGDEVLPETKLSQPRGRASVISSAPISGFGCGEGPFHACVGLDDYDDIEVIARRDGDTIMRSFWLKGPGAFRFDVAPDCLEFRRRSRTGQRSKALKICDEALGLRPYSREDDQVNDWGIVCDDGMIGVKTDESEESVMSDKSDASGADSGVGRDSKTSSIGTGGCSLAQKTPASGTWLAGLLALVALIRRRTFQR